MSLKKEKLLFSEQSIIKENIKNDQKLKIKDEPKNTHYEIKFVPPSCFQSSFEDEIWYSLNLNKSRGISESMNFTRIPKKWISYVKKILCIMDQLPQHGFAKPSAYGSFLTYFSVFVDFFNQIELLNCNDLQDLTEEDIRKIYFKYASNGYVKSRNAIYIRAIQKLYEYGPLGYKLLEDGLSTNPTTDYLLLGSVETAKNPGTTDTIDEESARLLISSAIDWVINKKQDMLDIAALAKFHYSTKESKFLSRGTGVDKSLTFVQARKALESNNHLYEKLLTLRNNFGKDLFLFLENRHQIGLTDIEPYLKDFMKINLISKKLYNIYQALTYVVCASFTGWRASEIFSINSSGIKETPTGYYFDSNLIKTTENKTELIARPVPDIVVQAIKNLEEIHLNFEGLFGEKIFQKNGKTNALFRTPMGNAADLKVLNEDLNIAWKHIGNNNFKFSTHQFRKFFAHFYIRRYKGTADAVRWNFRHISKDMILHYTNQAMNAKQLVASKKEFAREIANKIVKDNEYTSIGIGNELKDLSQNINLKAKVLSIEEASKFIEERIETEFKDIHAMEWGYCMFQNGYKGAACEAKKGPIESRSEPSTCGRCKFLCTGQEHISFWQQTILLHQDIVDNKFTTKIMKQESEKVLSIGTSILKRHDKKE